MVITLCPGQNATEQRSRFRDVRLIRSARLRNRSPCSTSGIRTRTRTLALRFRLNWFIIEIQLVQASRVALKQLVTMGDNGDAHGPIRESYLDEEPVKAKTQRTSPPTRTDAAADAWGSVPGAC